MIRRSTRTNENLPRPAPTPSTSSTPESASSPELVVARTKRQQGKSVRQRQTKAKVACIECQEKKRACAGLSVFEVVVEDGKGKGMDGARGQGWKDCDACLQRGLRCSGPVTHRPTPKTRQGNIISTLRHAAAPSISILHPEQSMPTLHLSYALQYHLLQACTGDSQPSDWFPIIKLGRVCEKFRRKKTQSQRSGFVEYEEIMMSCLLALGARRSTHSAITGVASPSVVLGPLRESICHQLTQRALDLVESSHRTLFDEDGTKEGLEIVVILRAVLQAVVSTNPYSPNLIRLANHQRNGILKDPEQPEPMKAFTRTCFGDSIVSLDATMSTKFGTNPILTETDLKKRYGWSRKKIDLALERIAEWHLVDGDTLEDEMEVLQENFRVITTYILRGIMEVRKTITGQTTAEVNTLKIESWLSNLSSLSSFLTLHPEFSPSSRYTPSLYSIPTLSAAHVLSFVIKELPSNPVRQAAQVAFVDWVGKLIDACWAHEYYFVCAAGTHSMGMIWDEMECLEGWIELAVKELDRARLFKLLKCLRYSADIYGVAALREGELRKALGLGDEAGEGGVARCIVQETLWEIGSEDGGDGAEGGKGVWPK